MPFNKKKGGNKICKLVQKVVKSFFALKILTKTCCFMIKKSELDWDCAVFSSKY